MRAGTDVAAAPAGAGDGARAVRPPAPRRKASTVPYRVLGYLSLLAVWQLISTFAVEDHIVPGPVSVVRSMGEIITSGDLVTHFGATIERTLLSLGLVLVVGTVVGVAMGLSRWWEAFFRDCVNLLLSVPGLISVLIALLIFGLNPAGVIVAIVVTNFAFVTVQVWEGVKSLPTDLMDMARSFGVSRWRVLRRIVMPALAPFLFTALKYGFALTWKLVMLTELFGSSSGVGFMMRLEFALFNMSGLIAWALLFYLFALFLERGVLQRLETRFFRWRVAAFE